MKSKAGWLGAAALAVAVATAVVLERGKAQVVPPSEPRYQTGCEVVDETTVEGFVKNPGTGLLRVDGIVRFSFTVANSMSRPTIQVPGNALVPPGRTVSVARAKLVWSLLPSEVCQFDVSGAIQ